MIPEILNSLQRADLFEKFKTQIEKDFGLCGLANYSPLFESNNLEHVFTNILKSISAIEQKNPEGLRNLLYRIDLSENQIKKEAAVSVTYSFQELIAQLIIKRILQKVIIKEKYSNKK